MNSFFRLDSQSRCRIFVVVEEPLCQGKRDEHELVVVLDLIDGEGTGDERVLMIEGQIRSEHVDAFGAFGRVQMQRAREMRIDADLGRQPATEYRAVKSTVPDGVVPVGDDGVDMRRAGEERVHAHNARRLLMIFVAYECGLLQLHGDGLDVLARVQRGDRERVGAQSLSFGRHDHQYGVKLREHLLYQCPEAVHHGQYTNHRRRNNRDSNRTNTGNDINGIMPFL